MTEKQLHEFSITEIVYDFKAIINCFQICMHNNVEPVIFQVFIPYLCVFVYSGIEYLENHNLIKIEDKVFKVKVEKTRSKFLKQYAELKPKTYKSLNDFNGKEYFKFFDKVYPKSNRLLTQDVKNYYIASINNKPIDNYHLSSGIFDCEIGSYIDDITPRIQAFISQMTKLIVQILLDAHIEYEERTESISFDNVSYVDTNMAYNYKNFGIQDNPPILMAFMDILCTVNSYNEVFIKVNIDKRLHLKVKFLVLFESIVGIKKLIEFCDSSMIIINIDDEFKRFLYRIDKFYCLNQLRRYCAHYGYLETDWKSDPVVEVFEKLFNKPIEEISEDLSNQLLKLGEYLNKFIIKVPFN